MLIKIMQCLTAFLVLSFFCEFNDLVKIRRSSSVQAEWPLTSYTSSKEVDLSFSITVS